MVAFPRWPRRGQNHYDPVVVSRRLLRAVLAGVLKHLDILSGLVLCLRHVQRAGKLLAFLAVPTDEVTNCAFGDDDQQTLYITGGGTIYSIRTLTPGRVLWPPRK